MAEKLGKMLTIKQVARELGVHDCTVRKIEKHDKSFPMIRVRADDSTCGNPASWNGSQLKNASGAANR